MDAEKYHRDERRAAPMFGQRIVLVQAMTYCQSADAKRSLNTSRSLCDWPKGRAWPMFGALIVPVFERSPAEFERTAASGHEPTNNYTASRHPCLNLPCLNLIFPDPQTANIQTLINSPRFIVDNNGEQSLLSCFIAWFNNNVCCFLFLIYSSLPKRLSAQNEFLLKLAGKTG